MTQRFPVALILVAMACISQRSNAAGEPGTDVALPAQIQHCVEQHQSARVLRLDQHWLEARAAMTACADARCPLAISADCRSWLGELSQALPSLLLVIERPDPGAPHPATVVELDGQPLIVPEPPAPIELLPGSHRLRLQFGEQAPVEREFSLVQGEKNHVEQFRWPKPPAPPPRVSAPEPARSKKLELTRPIPALSYVLSAGALAAFAGSTALLVSALHARNEARVDCAPTCAHSERTRIQTQLVLADVSAGAGLALAGAALYTFLRRPILTRAADDQAGAWLIPDNGSLRLVWHGEF